MYKRQVGERDANQLREDVDLLDGVYGELDTGAYLKGKVAPVFFGSAVNNFGVKELLDTFIRIAPHPLGRATAVSYTHLDVYKRQYRHRVHACDCVVNGKGQHGQRLIHDEVIAGKDFLYTCQG